MPNTALGSRPVFVVTHGLSRTAEYGIWMGIKHRCYNPRASGFHRYGGRGIRVCDRWRESFSCFFQDMGKRPTTDHSIDRINNDGNYEPGNCRWATRIEQQANRSDRIHTAGLNIPRLAKELGIRASTIRRRIERGWSFFDATTIGPIPKSATRIFYKPRKTSGHPSAAGRLITH